MTVSRLGRVEPRVGGNDLLMGFPFPLQSDGKAPRSIFHAAWPPPSVGRGRPWTTGRRPGGSSLHSGCEQATLPAAPIGFQGSRMPFSRAVICSGGMSCRVPWPRAARCLRRQARWHLPKAGRQDLPGRPFGGEHGRLRSSYEMPIAPAFTAINIGHGVLGLGNAAVDSINDAKSVLVGVTEENHQTLLRRSHVWQGLHRRGGEAPAPDLGRHGRRGPCSPEGPPVF